MQYPYNYNPGDSPLRQLIMLLLFCFLGAVVASILTVVCAPLFGISLMEVAAIQTGAGEAGALRFLQFSQLTSSIGVFILPPFLLMWYNKLKILPALHFSKTTASGGFFLAMAVILMLVQLPLINAFADLNKAMHLPESLQGLEQWMREKEDTAARITETFLKMPGIADYIIAMIIMAVIPALGEELLFRSTLQPLLTGMTGRKHLAIWITAFVFSAIHVQFFGFIPRFLIGAFLGYIFLWTGNIWIPVIAHFTNNGAAVTGYYLQQHGYIESSPDDLGTGSFAWFEILLASALFISGMLLFYKRSKKAF